MQRAHREIVRGPRPDAGQLDELRDEPIEIARGIEPQAFVARSDMGCGSTIGPISAARAGIRTVDVGSPMLSMHSCREMAAVADVAPMISVLGAFFETALELA